MSFNDKLVTIQGLSVEFYTEEGIARVVQDVSFNIERGQCYALVGESGCGKSVTALSIMRLIPDPPGRVTAGTVYFNGRDIYKLSEKQMRRIRGKEVSMIFQEPMTSLNPVYTVGDQVVEAIMLHQKKSYDQAWVDAAEMLRKVGIADPEQRAGEYPHQMSGGMRQRVMIAMAMSCRPDLLIADEPTTALDVTTQAQILDLLDSVKDQTNTSILLITHDLGVVAERADKVAVMYASRIVEKADSDDLFAEPLHPYTRGLLDSLPKLSQRPKRLVTIPGMVPEPLSFPSGCKFHPRCPLGSDDERCKSCEPMLREINPGREVACWLVKGYESEQERKEYERKYGKNHERISAQR